jgi:hypothetical protein
MVVMGDCLLWAVFLFRTIVAQILGLLFSLGKKLRVIFVKKGLGYNLGEIFTNSSGPPGPLALLLPLDRQLGKNGKWVSGANLGKKIPIGYQR